MGDIGQVGVSMALNIEGTGGEDEARRPATDHATPLPTVFADNPHEANDAGTYDTTYPAVSHEQFIRTNTSEFDNLLAVLDADTRGRSLPPPTVARTSDADRTTSPRYFGTTSVVTNETSRTNMNQEQPTNHHSTQPSDHPTTSLRQQAWIELPSFLFKLSKPTRNSRYKPLDMLTVREAWGIVQRLGEPGEFRSTINPSDAECQNAIDHIRKMKEDITSEYTVYAKQYAVRYMNEHWEDNAQVAVKMTSWSDAVKKLHDLKDVDDPRWTHVYQLKAGLFRSGKQQSPCRWLQEHMPKTYHATLDADMKTELNRRFINLHGGTKAHSEHLQAMCRTRYRDNVNSSIDNNTAKYCGIKLTLDKPGHNSKHQLLKTVAAMNGEKAYHFVRFNGNLDRDDATNERNTSVAEAAVGTNSQDEVEQEVDRENVQWLERLENHTFENPNMMSQNPFDVLKYLVLSKMMHQDLVPKFVAWNREILSASIVSDLTEDNAQQRTNPLLSFQDRARTNQTGTGQEEQETQEEAKEDNCEEHCENYQDTLANFDLSASEDELDDAHPGYGLEEDTDPSGTNKGTIPNNQKENQGEIQAGVTEKEIEEERSVEIQPGACQQPTNEETNLGIHSRGDEDRTGTDSTESSKKRKAMQRRSEEDGQEDGEETECIHLQSRSRQLPVLPNTGRFELQKKYQLVKRLMVRGMSATYYFRCKNALEDNACLFIWCTGCKPKTNRRERLLEGCKHDKQSLVRCNETDFELLKCENVYNSDQSFEGNVPSRCMGCQNRIVVDLDEEKATTHLG